MGDEQHEKIQQRAYAIWEREGGVHGDHERHWHTAKAEIDREAALPLTAGERFRKPARSPAPTS